MIITKLEGFNWGRHSKIEFECAGDIAGILGSNGAGKSSILALIEFLITGETQDELASYVKSGQANGGGSLDFIKNGCQGTIFRQVGKTSKRQLNWDGQEFKKAADVDRTMNEIFGADKKAMASSVFVNQGTLEDVLFKKGVDRTKAFIRLVNLSFCETRARMLDGQISRIQDMVIDLGPARDEAGMARLDALNVMNAKAEALGVFPNYEAELAHIRETAAAGTEQGVLRQQMGESGITRAARSTELSVKLDGQTVEDIANAMLELDQELSTQRSESLNYGKLLTELTHYSRIKTEIGQLRLSDATAATALKSINPNNDSLEVIGDYIAEIDKDLAVFKVRRQLESSIQAAALSLASMQTQFEQLVQPQVSREDIDGMWTEVKTKNGNLALINQWLTLQDKIQEQVSKPGQKCDGSCTECGQSLELVVPADADMRKAQTAAASLLKTEVSAIEQRIRVANTALVAYERTKTQFETGINQWQTAITRDQTKLDGSILPAFDEVQLQAERLRWVQLQADIANWNTENKQRQDQLTEKNQALKHYPLAEANWAFRTDYTPAGHQLWLDSIKTLETRRSELNQIWQTVQGLIDQIKTIEADLEKKQARLVELDAILNAAAPEQLQTQLMAAGGNTQLVETQMVASEQIRSNLIGEHKAAVEAYQAANARFQDLERRILQNQKKMALLHDLIRLKKLLADDGLPLMFIKNKFNRLAAFTQEGLLKMNANFFISVDKDRDLEFSFHRLDDKDSPELPMNKLSGGQKVRLCVSFLTALQKVLLKDVGLLVLDEFSCHLDDAGMDQVVEFVRSMKQELQNAEHQIWIVDHNPKIQMALDKVMWLK